MSRKPNGKHRPADVVGCAVKVAKIATGETEDVIHDDKKDKAAVALGRKGGKAGALKLTKDQLRDTARHAAKVRWAAKSD